ncbi:MAG: hypothetical protein H6696_04660 [Deferribacteres bacterium]|nr:hypothetical protein [Deferribacteres bacterium]
MKRCDALHFEVSRQHYYLAGTAKESASQLGSSHFSARHSGRLLFGVPESQNTRQEPGDAGIR